MTTYFTSDTHYSHENIIKYCARPFNSAEEMNEEMVRRHNETVGPNDVVWHLGDFSMRFETMLPILPRLNGTKVLIAGNHDSCHPRYKFKRNAHTVQEYLDAGWARVILDEFGSYIDPKDGGSLLSIPVIMGHYPKAVDLGYVLHGHVHEKWRVKGNNINVGVDVWDFRPISTDKIREVIKEIKDGKHDAGPLPEDRYDDRSRDSAAEEAVSPSN